MSLKNTYIVNLKNKFLNLQWHDATLINIFIDRSNPGYVDEVRLLIEWPDDTTNTLIFNNCLSFKADMNFWFICEENILTADFYEENEIINGNKNVLIRYVIKTNTTGGEIIIRGKNFSII